MDNQKIYLMAEVTVLPEFLDDVKGALKQALIPTLQEAGCEGLFETSREGDPHKLVFFEIAPPANCPSSSRSPPCHSRLWRQPEPSTCDYVMGSRHCGSDLP